jgi:hypothetical protein
MVDTTKYGWWVAAIIGFISLLFVVNSLFEPKPLTLEETIEVAHDLRYFAKENNFDGIEDMTRLFIEQTQER